MIRILAILLLGLLPSVLSAQPDSSHLRISLLTVSPGEQIYASFGHTGVRITDSVNQTDIVFNYGTFDGYDKDFEMKFAKGKLNYYISSDPFRDFMYTYVREQRTVQEQELFLSGPQKIALYDFLIENEKPQNKYYKYDFLFDNCATRIRDIFPKTFGKGFHFGRTLPAGHEITFRHIINYYLRGIHWERFGINILLGSQVDKPMSNEEIMFLPDYLRDGIGNATVEGRKIATAPVTLLDMPPVPEPGTNVPMLVMLGVCLLTILGLSIPSLKPLGAFMSTLVLIISGLLGCLILVMWLGTDHQTCRDNWNVLWALPTNVLVPFLRHRNRDRYAAIAIVLLLVSLLLHVFHIQELPLVELWPLLLALLYIYGMIYKRNRDKKKPYAAR
jgi:hypothetical protein